MNDTNRAIHSALNTLMKACGFSGESGTEAMFCVLQEAVQDVANNWHVVEENHEDGLCYDVNALLSDAIEMALNARAANDAE